MNKVILLGRLTRDPELRYQANTGKANCRFTLAINRIEKDKADFINCVAFGKTAETISQYFTKGRQIAITGSIRTGSYDAQDGTKRYTTDIFVESFEFTGDKNVDNKQEASGTYGDNAFGIGDITPVEDGDMPF